MRKTLYRIAAISSPLIALYGAAPVLLLDRVKNENFFGFFFGLSTIVFIFWLINIFLIVKIPSSKNIKRYFLSYFFTMSFQLLVLYFIVDKVRPRPERISAFYPLLTEIAVNTIILLISNAIILRFQKLQIAKENEALKIQNLEAEKMILVQQLQPHFLFNALSVLKSLIKTNTEHAEDYTIKLSKFLRYSIQSKEQQIVSVAEELTFTKDYVSLQQMRFGSSFECSYDINEDTLHKKVPIYAIQTLVENCIKHNKFNERHPIIVRIASTKDALIVENNIAAKSIDTTSGTGLKNLNKRYLIYSNQEIKIEQTENLFKVTLPLLQ